MSCTNPVMTTLVFFSLIYVLIRYVNEQTLMYWMNKKTIWKMWNHKFNCTAQSHQTLRLLCVEIYERRAEKVKKNYHLYHSKLATLKKYKHTSDHILGASDMQHIWQWNIFGFQKLELWYGLWSLRSISATAATIAAVEWSLTLNHRLIVSKIETNEPFKRNVF